MSRVSSLSVAAWLSVASFATHPTYAQTDLKVSVLNSYAACDAGLALGDVKRCAALRHQDYKQVGIDGKVTTSQQVDAAFSREVGGRYPLKQTTVIESVRLLDANTAIVRVSQTSSRIQGGDEIKSDVGSRWSAWDATERKIERKWHSIGDQRWEKQGSEWRLLEARVLQTTADTRLMPND